MTKKLVLALAVAGVLIFGANSLVSSSQEESALKDLEKTNRQKEHGKLYKHYKQAKKLAELVAAQPGGVRITVGPPNQGGDLNAPAFDPHAFLSGLACEADAVVVGEVKEQSSQLTEDEDFIFTDYELSVEEVLKSDAVDRLQANSRVIVTRPGGRVVIDGQLAEAVDLTFKPLVTGKRYLLFLKLIPATGAYSSVSSRASFELSGKKSVKQTAEFLGGELEGGDAASLLASVRSAVSGGCERRVTEVRRWSGAPPRSSILSPPLFQRPS